MRTQIVSALCALALACPPAAKAEPLTLDTLLGLETFGRIAMDPSGTVGIFEERRARGDLPRYDLQPEGALRYARLYRIDMDAPGRVRPLLAMEADAGYTAGPFSPDGRRLVIFRLQGLTFRLGVVDLQSETVAWTDLSPETGAWGRAVQWISGTEFLVLGMPDGGLPPRLDDLITTQMQLPDHWARAARGEAAFVSVAGDAPDRERPMRALWRVDGRTGRATLLSQGPFLDFEASPDGRHAALLKDGPLLPPPDQETATEYRRARSLRLVDTRSGAAVDPVGAKDISTSLLAWSPDSSALLVARVGSDPARLLAVSPAGAVEDRTPPGVRPDTAVDMFGSPTAHAGWLAGDVVVRGRRDGHMGWHLQRDDTVLSIGGLSERARVVAHGAGAALFADRGRIVRLRSDRTLEDLGPAAALSRPDGPLGHRARTDPMGADNAALSAPGERLCRVTADARPRTCVSADTGASVSWTRRISIQHGAEGRAQNQLEVRDENGAEVVWRLNPELDEVDVPAARRVSGPDGSSGWLYLPDAASGRPPPVIVIPYPGKTYPVPPRNMRPEAVQMTLNGELLVAAGYAVLYPDLPTTGEPSEGLADRILAVVDAAAADDLFDPDRIGLWGHSFGAWAAVLSASQSPRFSAVVALNGPYHPPLALAGLSPHQRMRGENHEDAIGGARWLETGQAGMLRPYWADPERYGRASAFERADRITAPTLLIHGEMDILAGQAELMYAALVRLNRPVALTYLFGEDHSIHNPGNARIYYEQLTAWFDRHLRPGDPRSDVAIAAATPLSAPD
jgi:dipeptidyl aminopeptidase/acylaminoacyl peptidase